MRIEKGGIAFFDSGIGGLTVLSACQKFLQNETVYYYGDNAHAPYGNLSLQKIEKYVNKAFRLFKKLNVQAVVIACNTVTAVCVEKLRKRYVFPIIGAEPAVFSTIPIEGEVFILSTKATYESKRFQTLCKKAKKQGNVTLYPFACERLAGEIETHLLDNAYSYDHLLPQGNPKAVVLGCTHYIYIKKLISNFYQCPVYDGNEGIAKRLRSILNKNGKKSSVLLSSSNQFRDERPPSRFFAIINKIFFLEKVRKQKGNNANKCSWLQKTPDGQKWRKIYFLGSGKKRNFEVFEHTFGF